MGFLSTLNQTCSIESPSETQTGTGAITRSWVESASNVSTRYHRAQKERVINGDYQVTLEDFVFYFKSDVTITKSDRIVADSKNFEVITVVEHSKSHHLSVYARLIDFA